MKYTRVFYFISTFWVISLRVPTLRYIKFVLDRTLAGIFMSDVAMDGGPDILGSIVDNTIRESHEKNYDFRPSSSTCAKGGFWMESSIFDWQKAGEWTL